MKKISKALLLILTTILLLGCLGGSEDSETKVSIGVNYDLSAVISKTVSNRAPKSLLGTMKATKLPETQEETAIEETFTWYVVLDEEAFTISSNSTMVLEPGTYNFDLEIIDGNHQYLGQSLNQIIEDGTNEIDLTLKPIIGEVNTTVSLDQTSNFKFNYPLSELANVTNPQLGIILDGAAQEVVYELNTVDGTMLSSSEYFVIAPGEHTIDIKLYDGNVQIGKSIDDQESVVAGSESITMDLVPLNGEAIFALGLEGSEAVFNFTFPEEIITEVGGLGNLEAILTLTSTVNGTTSSALTVEDNAGVFESTITYEGFRYDEVDLQIQFIDKLSSEEVATGLLIDVELSDTENNQVMEIDLIRRSIISGNILGVLALNVYDQENKPVEGATVYLDGEEIGLTGAGTFGTVGYFKTYLKEGTYEVRVVNAGETEEKNHTLTIDVLVIENINFVLEEVVEPMPSFAKMYGGNSAEVNYSAIESTLGDYLLVGGTLSTDIEGEINNGSRDAYVVKTNLNGEKEWEKLYGGSYDEYIYSVIESNLGGYILVGSSMSSDIPETSNNGSNDIYIIKINEIGEKEWEKLYGGSNDEVAYSIIKSSLGGYIILGYSSSNNIAGTGYNGNQDIYIIKIDETGEKEWEKLYGGSGSDYGYSIIESSLGGYVLLGRSTSTNMGDANNGNSDVCIIKIDEFGEKEWEKLYGGSNDDYGYSITESSLGGYVLLGYTHSTDIPGTTNNGNSDFYVVKVDELGEKEWEKLYGGSRVEFAYSIIESSLGGYVLSGMTSSFPNYGSNDFYVIKVNDSGLIEWEEKYGGSGSDQCRTIIESDNGGYVLSGYSSTADKEGLINSGSSDYLIYKIKPDGTMD